MARARESLPEGRVRRADLLILLLLGTHEQPFRRAIEAVAPLAEDDEVVVQHGHTPRGEAVGVRWIEFAPYEQIFDLCGAAEAVVSHAGVGTIMTALAASKTPVVIPRLARYGEHVDDHQLQIARAFEERELVVVLTENEDVSAAIARARGRTSSLTRSDRLRRAVADAVG